MKVVHNFINPELGKKIVVIISTLDNSPHLIKDVKQFIHPIKQILHNYPSKISEIIFKKPTNKSACSKTSIRGKILVNGSGFVFEDEHVFDLKQFKVKFIPMEDEGKAKESTVASTDVLTIDKTLVPGMYHASIFAS